MASKIEKALVKATGIEKEDGEKRVDFLTRLFKKVAKLDKDEWEALGEAEQDWYNDNADARNKAKKADKDLPDVTDFADAEAEAPAKKGRRAADDDGDDKGGKDAGSLAVGVRAKITTKKGKTYEGVVSELDDEMVVLKDADGKETEIDLAKIDSKEVFHGNAKGAKAKDEEPADPLAVGNVVTVLTKRNKEVTGKIVSIDDDEIVLDVDGEEEEFQRSRVESITPKAGGKKAPTKPAKEEEPEPPKGKGKSEDDDAGDDKKRSKNDSGVSVGTVITELVCDDLEATEEAIGKALKKKGVEFKENTLHLNFVAVHKVIAVLKTKKMLKA